MPRRARELVEPSVPVSLVNWYAERHRRAAELLEWIDHEVGPIIAVVVEGERHIKTIYPGRPMFAPLDIPLL